MTAKMRKIDVADIKTQSEKVFYKKESPHN